MKMNCNLLKFTLNFTHNITMHIKTMIFKINQLFINELYTYQNSDGLICAMDPLQVEGSNLDYFWKYKIIYLKEQKFIVHTLILINFAA